MVATGSLMAVSVVLVESDRGRTIFRLALVYGSVAAATLIHAQVVGGEGRIVEAVVGSSVLALAFGLTYLLFATSSRVATYDHELHRALFDVAGDGVVVVDGAGVISRANPVAEAMFGFERGGLVGRSVSELMLPELRDRHRDHMAAFMKGGSGARPMRDRPVLEALRSWGETFPAEISISSFEVGGRRMAAATVRDVGRRVRAEEEARRRLQLYRELYERVPVALYRTTPDGRFEGGNRELVALLGAGSFDELSEVTADSFFVDPEERGRVLARMAEGPGEALFQIRTLDGRLRWVRDHGRPVRDEEGEVVAYEGAVEDVTEQVEAAAALEASTRAQQRLVATVAHHLRTPLTVVLGYADVLAQSAHRTDEVAELAGLVREHAYELSSLVDEAVLASRIDGEGLPLVSGELLVDDAVAAAVKVVGETAVEAKPSGLVVRGDPLRVEQAVQLVLSHVLRNGGHRVGVDAGAVREGEVEIVVSYEGPAVPPGERDELFDPFAATIDSSQPGRLNLGLGVARRLARLMGGDLTYDGDEERGCFVFTLPAADRVGSSPR